MQPEVNAERLSRGRHYAAHSLVAMLHVYLYLPHSCGSGSWGPNILGLPSVDYLYILEALDNTISVCLYALSFRTAPLQRRL